ncbi:MAG: RsmB/NOP family class I SAM-dependent RNA methyltransferase [Oscillospiraceae bacterium]|nr:RsmB/NOP family class I SAM-dependent RNA methyltransferase [Oscillospiraceae bacterium]
MPDTDKNRKGPADRKEELLKEIRRSYSLSAAEEIISGLSSARSSSFRINRLRTGVQTVEERLAEIGVGYEKRDWFEDAFVIDSGDEKKLREEPMYERGEIYMQNLSAMIPPLMTGISDGQDVLDMCAAPGGKTTQIVSLSGGKANVTACEKDRIRAERLRYNLARQGCTGVNVLQTDARKLDSFLRFDRIFLDAPCSGSGTVLLDQPDTYKAFSEKLVRNSAKLQLQLLRKGLSLLKKGGVLVYSTCSVLPEENEDVVRTVLRDGGAELVPPPESLRQIPSLDSSVPEALLVCPGRDHEGFFAVMIRKT